VDFLKSGKFPTLTDEDLKLVLDRFLLTKVSVTVHSVCDVTAAIAAGCDRRAQRHPSLSLV